MTTHLISPASRQSTITMHPLTVFIESCYSCCQWLIIPEITSSPSITTSTIHHWCLPILYHHNVIMKHEMRGGVLVHDVVSMSQIILDVDAHG